MAYVFQRPAKDGKVRFTAMYKAENGKYRSAGTYDDEDRAQQVADESERHAHLRLAETSPGEKATITVEEFMPKFLREHAIEPNSRQRYAEVLRSHAIPYVGYRRVAEISRETFHRLLTVVLKDEGVGQPTILYARTALSAMMQMAWDHGYRDDNPLRGIRLKGVPGKLIVVATSAQFQRVYDALPHQPAKVFARLGVASGARLCELISFTPEDFDFDTDMLSVNKSTVEVTAEFHPEGYRFLTRSYTKNGGHRRFKIDAVVSEMVQEHIEKHGIGPGQLIFPVRLFAKREASGKPRLSKDELDVLGPHRSAAQMGVATATGPWAHTLRLSAAAAAASNGAPITPATASAPGPAVWKGNGRRGGGETLRSTWELTCGVAPGARQSKMPGCLLPTSVSGPAYTRFLAHRQGGGPGTRATQARSR